MALIWGRHPVVEALRANRSIDRVLVAESVRPDGLIAEILQRSRERGIRVQYLERQILDRLTNGANHQGVVAEVAEYRYRSLGDTIQLSKQASGLPLILALDTLEDPQNFGTLPRSADAVGATAVIIPLHRAVGVTPGVAKSSAGAVEYLPIARVTNLAKALDELKRHGYWVVGLDAAGTTLYDATPVDVPLVLVVGSEERGLGHTVSASCDLLVKLPMRGHVESLNAAIAGSIVLYDVWRRRGFV